MADPRAIHEFLTGEVEATTLLLGDFVDLDAQSGYTTYKASVSDIGEVILEDIEYTQDLQTVDKTIIGAINEQQSVIGYSYDEYDATTAYAKDDLCIYNNVLYKAKQATTGNLPTNTTYWEQTSIADEIGRIDTALSGKQDKSWTTITIPTPTIDPNNSNKRIYTFTNLNSTDEFFVQIRITNYGIFDGRITKATQYFLYADDGFKWSGKVNIFPSTNTIEIITNSNSYQPANYPLVLDSLMVR